MPDTTIRILPGTARSIGAAIAAGQLSSVEVTRYYLERIEALNGGENGLNCVRSVSPLALIEARRADAELAAGKRRGPLHGVPYLIKDNVFTADGSPASAGSQALAGFVPPFEATVVARRPSTRPSSASSRRSAGSAAMASCRWCPARIRRAH